jgi:hypothetical protein
LPPADKPKFVAYPWWHVLNDRCCGRLPTRHRSAIE